MTHDMERYLARWTTARFGDSVDMRFGNYERIENVSRREEDVAVDFARAGYRKLLLTRETTDNNNYANAFATRSWIDRGLCKAGFATGIAIDQLRQVGRTPEYNTLLMRNIGRYLPEFDKAREVSMLYVTYGLPWPGGNPTAGPFSTPQIASLQAAGTHRLPAQCHHPVQHVAPAWGAAHYRHLFQSTT